MGKITLRKHLLTRQVELYEMLTLLQEKRSKVELNPSEEEQFLYVSAALAEIKYIIKLCVDRGRY